MVFCIECKHYWENTQGCRISSIGGYRSIVITGDKKGKEHWKEITGYKNACLKNFKFVELPDAVTPIKLITDNYTGSGLEWCEEKNSNNDCKDYDIWEL